MSENEKALNFIKSFSVTAGALLIFCAVLVLVFDPFYHFHKPLPGLKAVLSDKEYQVPGTLDHFDYDAVIAGSSVAENNNNRWYDEAFSCTTVKAIRSYGATADLCYYLDRAFDHKNIRYVFFNLDPSSLIAGTESTTFASVGAPMYLYDRNPLNDVKYVWNKAVIFEKIPYMLANSLTGDYDEGAGYNWAQWKAFDRDTILYNYIREPNIEEMKDPSTYLEICEENTALLKERIEAHPETEFYIFIPPYSILWWDALYRGGDTISYIEMEKQAAKELLSYENVRFFNFQSADDITYNLDNYTDSLHFSPEINKYICDCLKDGTYEIKDEEAVDKVFADIEKTGLSACDHVDEHYKDEIKVAYYGEDQ